MRIVAEVILIIIGIFAGFIYEGYEKIQDKTLMTKKNRKHMIYFIASSIAMIILAVNLEMRYDNPFIHNMKLQVLLLFLVPIALIDYKKGIIPNRVVAVGSGIRIFIFIIEMIINRKQAVSELKSVSLGLLLILFFAIFGIFFVKNGLGMGDIKLMFMMVLYLGFSSSFSAIFMALLFSLIAAIILMIQKKKSRKDTLPFAPCILLGTYISILLTGM